MRQKIAWLSVASLLFLAYFDKGEICFLENLILFAFILFVIYHFIFGNYCLTIVQLSFNHCFCLCCKAVHSSAWLLHYIKSKKRLILKCFSFPTFQLCNFATFCFPSIIFKHFFYYLHQFFY